MLSSQRDGYFKFIYHANTYSSLNDLLCIGLFIDEESCNVLRLIPLMVPLHKLEWWRCGRPSCIFNYKICHAVLWILLLAVIHGITINCQLDYSLYWNIFALAMLGFEPWTLRSEVFQKWQPYHRAISHWPYFLCYVILLCAEFANIVSKIISFRIYVAQSV